MVYIPIIRMIALDLVRPRARGSKRLIELRPEGGLNEVEGVGREKLNAKCQRTSFIRLSMLNVELSARTACAT